MKPTTIPSTKNLFFTVNVAVVIPTYNELLGKAEKPLKFTMLHPDELQLAIILRPHEFMSIVRHF